MTERDPGMTAGWARFGSCCAEMFAAPLPASPTRPHGRLAQSWKDFEWLGATPFVALHVLPFLAFWTGTKWQDWACLVFLYVLRMFAVTGFYHRYFAHRTYKTSRVMQFILAFVAQTSSQKGALWWAQHHRDHHKYSDTDKDVHSPKKHGFWYAHVGWIYDHTSETDYAKIKDFAKYPELVFLNRAWGVPPILLGALVFWTLDLSGLLIGFMLSTVLVWHGTFTINSLMHLVGNRRFNTTDDSRNGLVLALVTLGEGWHNNHHYFMGSTRQGFYWWEIDITYYLLKLMSFVGLVWDIREPPQRVYEEAKAAKAARARGENPYTPLVEQLP